MVWNSWVFKSLSAILSPFSPIPGFKIGKAEIDYQELVSLAAKALDPNAEIKTGQLIERTDSNREVEFAQ